MDPLEILLVLFGAAVGLGVLWNVESERTDDATGGCFLLLLSIFWLYGSMLAFSVTAVVAACTWFGWWGLLSLPVLYGAWKLLWWLLECYGFRMRHQKR